LIAKVAGPLLSRVTWALLKLLVLWPHRHFSFSCSGMCRTKHTKFAL